MNLRDKFIWNVLIGLAFIAVTWYGWELFNNNSKMKKLYTNYENEQVGTDEKLQEKVSSLESIYKFRSKNGFITIIAQSFKSQKKNKDDAINRLEKLFSDIKIQAKRIPTKPSWSSKVKRVENKKKRSQVKKSRRQVSLDD